MQVPKIHAKCSSEFWSVVTSGWQGHPKVTNYIYRKPLHHRVCIITWQNPHFNPLSECIHSDYYVLTPPGATG